MKLLARTLVASIALLTANVAVAAERTVTLAVENMTCALCGPIVRKSLERVPGVRRVEVSEAERTATVVFDDATTTVAALVAATTNAGYPSQPLR